MRRVANWAMAAFLALPLSACGLTAGIAGGDAQGSGPVVTPLEARDALESLDVFGTCVDPYRPDVAQDEIPTVTVVRCFVLDQDEVWRGVNLKRNVTVVVPGENWAAWIETSCRSGEAAWRVVTDDGGFIAYGYLDDGPKGALIGPWPDEIWPEDAQRVLGGQVRSLSEVCEANGTSTLGR